MFKGFVNDLDVRKQAEELGVSVWQAPSVLFIFMGLVTIVAMTAVYFASRNDNLPELLVLSETAVVIIIFTIGNFIIRNIEQIARINKMKSEFVSIASHQLKTPLTQINWVMELLFSKYRDGLNQKQVEIMETVGRSTSRMLKLANDLLDVARIDQKRFILARENIDIVKIVEESIQDNQILAKANNVDIEVVKNEDLPEITGDKRKIKVVIDNLISNAIKYINKKGLIKINIGLDNNFIAVCVNDNGVGIPKDQHDKVFQKFFRSNNVAKYQTEGTGLGLYIAKNIIEQSGGKIWFESEENVGSTFCFSLPLNH
jgi:signal transduction histidine kinase